jgi:DNA-binding transcriptional ArsR family regulator
LSAKATAWAWEQDPKGTRKLVLLVLADHADDNHDAWPAHSTISARVGVSRSNVQDHLRELEKAALIKKSPRARSNGSQTSNLYELQVEPPPASEQQESGATAAETGHPPPCGQGTILPGEQGTPNLQQEPTEEPPLQPPGSDGDPIAAVHAHYVRVMEPRSDVLGEDDRRIIRDALKVATVEECKRAISGCRSSSFHMGDNQKRKKYNTLSQILRGKRGRQTTRERIDFFLDLADKSGVQSGVTSADPARVSQAKRDVLDAWEFPNDEHVTRRGREAKDWLVANGVVVEYEENGRPTFRWAS